MRRPAHSLSTPLLAIAAVIALSADFVFSESANAVGENPLANIEDLPDLDAMSLSISAPARPEFDGVTFSAAAGEDCWEMTFDNPSNERVKKSFTVRSMETSGSAVGRMMSPSTELATQTVDIDLKPGKSLTVALDFELPEASEQAYWFRSLSFDLTEGLDQPAFAQLMVEETEAEFDIGEPNTLAEIIF
jgi:hypothetical protein